MDYDVDGCSTLIVTKQRLPETIRIEDAREISLGNDYKEVGVNSSRFTLPPTLQNFKFFFYTFQDESLAVQFLVKVNKNKEYKAFALDCTKKTSSLIIGQLEKSSCEFRILETNFDSSRKLNSSLQVCCYFTGIGQIIASRLVVGDESSFTSTILLFPEGTRRIKSNEELMDIRAKEKKERLQKAIDERNTGKARNRRRVSPSTEFKNFLVAEFGRDFLSSGEGVVDVAGGKGELSFKLQCVSKVKATIIDPRRPQLAYLKYLSKDHIFRNSGTNGTCGLFLPKHVQSWFYYNKGNIEDQELESKLISESDNKYAQESLGNACENERQKLESIIANCSIVVGLHPDQATEYIVDYCLDHEKPFAIVPCCVFPKSALFSHRKHIKSYHSFLEYLVAKDPQGRIRKKELEFPGRNICLYFRS